MNPRRANGSRRDKALARVRASGDPCWICGFPIDRGRRTPDPYSIECDELVPVSKGGSPYDRDNTAPAHRCCNGWRKAKPVDLVASIRAEAAARFGGWGDPGEFVRMAKAVEAARRGAKATMRHRTTTDW